MNKVKFIYNPYSGENSILNNIDKVIKIHQKKGYTIIPYRISMEFNIDRAFEDIDDNYKYILIAGGDGTVDTVVNCMKNRGLDIPIAILPVGTANDFAKFIGMPSNIEKACKQILSTEVKKIDLGKINDKYFLNVASMGLFTDISQKTDVNLKNTMGKLAYYIKGIEQLPNFRKLKVKVRSEKSYFDGDIYLMFIFNGQTAGNLNFAYKAQVDDGLLDVIIIKAINPVDFFGLFINMLKGDHLNNSSIIYFKTDKLEIECHEDITTDIDGEKGPDFPLRITCIKHGLKILGMEE
ncbi:diacylglycerol kinase [Clostridium pasteurianum DSM 525 = ATCC 6013]|uniref:Diacylglycerol kinase n=1 Tax=Clostridium pasteurianum DSM 525 = ATCC 6013 TaxID=1262449 RepID=A0A0H3J3L4_CLOPA|nr:YegS/Rv2252/BmrU family lipid kinase [Clostridium pasteurianum]AJA47417.1 diacylglycerol kinase [Clostridium pasteurianum DSM 525 = ATCC 6013]AJA51405.1 diacylglycerol kinase [Clostridium pasteurianum DSM 525 = ATCC 6013]AOZ74744.1 lipid kinase [Clostridium pasteurianum DSM 525 = ATCC 6013]AOZ78540.1 lipid kinase [Clostridium pasteurianum]ELP58752.1 lipid kinase [Clostridium pasteurianum DSM 525 = ATCC 6013]